MVKRINMCEVWKNEPTQVVKVQILMNGFYAILRNWKTQSVFEYLDWSKSQSELELWNLEKRHKVYGKLK